MGVRQSMAACVALAAISNNKGELQYTYLLFEGTAP